MNFIRIIFVIASSVLLTDVGLGQVGINTDQPLALLDLTSKNEETDGIIFPTVHKFSSTDPSSEQNAMLVFFHNNTNQSITGFDGLYFWDDEHKEWQYIFQSKMLDMNLYKTIVQAQNFNSFSISPASASSLWHKVNLDLIESPNISFHLDQGNFIIGRTGAYSVFFDMGIMKGQSSTNATQTEVGIFVNDNLTLISQIPLPSADNEDRAVTHIISDILNLSKGDKVSIQVRRTNGSVTPITISSTPSLIVSYLD